MLWKVDMMKQAVEAGLVSEDVPLAFFWNLTEFQKQIQELKAAFPSHWLHTVATKANPLQRIILAAREAGAGAEGASIGEMTLAMNIHEPANIMLDSPAKTKREIYTALCAGVGLTLDNESELERVAKIRDTVIAEGRAITSVMGIRINPQIGTGRIATFSVSKKYSKFGVPIERREALLAAYRNYPFLNMVHVHAGSQSYTLEQIAGAIRIAVDFANEVNAERAAEGKPPQVTVIDIGGGLTVNFATEENTPSFAEWRKVLEEHVPELFTGEVYKKVITEYGRRLLAKQGVIVSRIEYTKVAGGRRIVLQHAGADVCVRTVYRGEAWPLRISAFNTSGNYLPPASEEELKTILPADVAGPCCIEDTLTPNLRNLPEVHEGDYLMIHDTGAYFHSSWSYYNCRLAPALYCFYEPREGEKIHFETIRPMGTLDECLSFFQTTGDAKRN